MEAQGYPGDTDGVEGLTEFEVRVACGRLTALAPQLRALAKVVAREQFWRICRKELQGRDLDDDGWIIKPRWFGIVVVAAGRRGRITGPSTIEWRAFADLLAGRGLWRHRGAGLPLGSSQRVRRRPFRPRGELIAGVLAAGADAQPPGICRAIDAGRLAGCGARFTGIA